MYAKKDSNTWALCISFLADTSPRHRGDNCTIWARIANLSRSTYMEVEAELLKSRVAILGH